MAVDREQILNAFGTFIAGIGEASSDVLKSHPSKSIGTDFNKLLLLAQSVAPEVDFQIWPAPLANSDLQSTRENYLDISILARRVESLLKPGIQLAMPSDAVITVPPSNSYGPPSSRGHS